MKIIKSILQCICVMLSMTALLEAKGWRGIMPLHSTRADVERLLGKPNFGDGVYDLESERVSFIYSEGPCSMSSPWSVWNVRRDTVVEISIGPKMKMWLLDLKIDVSKYKKSYEGDMTAHAFYANEEEGITYEVLEGATENGLIMAIYYRPAAKDNDLRCQDNSTGNASSRRPHSVCPAVRFNCQSGVMKDEGLITFTINLSGYNPAVTPTFTWSISSGRIINGQGTPLIKVDTRGLPRGTTVKATVDIGGFGPDCQHSFSTTSQVHKRK